MLKGFKDFLMRGNVVDLAVAVVIGAAFGKVIESFVGVLMGIIGKIGGQPDFSRVSVADINIGIFINSVISFVVIAAAVYFVVVVPLNRLAERRKSGVEPEPKAPSEEVLILGEIRDALRSR